MPTSRPPMRQQQGAYPVPRASRLYPPANPHRVGHLPGIHPEDQPQYFSDDLEEDDSYYSTRMPTSARRYVQPQQPQVIQRGNKRIIIHKQPPPRKWHWSVYVGVAIFIMVVGYLLVTMLGVWWQGKQDDWAYGNPRTYQTDMNVGHGTSQQPMSHFIAVNLNGTIQVIEIPGNDSSKAHLYNITTLPAGSGDVPVTLKFQDMNADGKLDMLVVIGDAGGQQFTIFLLNNGSQFVSKL